MVQTKLKADPGRDIYFERVEEFPLKVLRSPAQYKAALAMSARFLGKPMDEGTRSYVSVLIRLIQDYEADPARGIDVSKKTDAAEIVRHLMGEAELSIAGLAKEVGLGQSNLSEMLSGKRAWSVRAIKAMSERFALDAKIFFA